MTRRVDRLREEAAVRAEERFTGAARGPVSPVLRREFLREVFGAQAASAWDDLPELLCQAARDAGTCFAAEARAALGRLVRHLDDRAPGLLIAAGSDPDEGFLPGLTWLAELGERWERPIETWEPEPEGVEAQFSALLRHLLARYPVPEVMDDVFSGRYRELLPVWFWHVGTGGNLRTAEGFPVPLTRKMAHHALEAPPGLDLIRAIRRGQVLGLGGTEQQAAGISSTLLGRRLGSWEEEAWWLTVVHWLVNHPDLPPAQHGPVVDYLAQRRREQPEFSMKGRSPGAVLELMEAWHQELNRRKKAREKRVEKPPEFPLSGFNGGTWEFGEGRLKVTWTMQEIRDAEELREEGRRMHHCAGSYVWHASNGHSSIWSLSVQRNGYSGPVLTIEVDQRARAVAQVRGQSNRLATVEEREIVTLWATANRLEMDHD